MIVVFYTETEKLSAELPSLSYKLALVIQYQLRVCCRTHSKTMRMAHQHWQTDWQFRARISGTRLKKDLQKTSKLNWSSKGDLVEHTTQSFSAHSKLIQVVSPSGLSMTSKYCSTHWRMDWKRLEQVTQLPFKRRLKLIFTSICHSPLRKINATLLLNSRPK